MNNNLTRFYAARHLADRLVESGLAPLFRELVLEGDGRDLEVVREQMKFWQRDKNSGQPDIDAVMLGALGYALGRMTTAVSTVAEDIRNAWPDLSEQTRKGIQTRIREAIDADRAGMDIDRAVWDRLLESEIENPSPSIR